MTIRRYDFEVNWPGEGAEVSVRPDGEYVAFADYAADVGQLVATLHRKCDKHSFCVCELMGQLCETCRTTAVLDKFAEFLPKPTTDGESQR